MRSQELIQWIEGNLLLVSGFRVGQPFKLLRWQKQFLNGTFKRGVTRSALSIARGPGKTSLAAAVGASALVGPLRQQRGEVILVASSMDQARILMSDIKAFLDPWIDRDPKSWRVVDNQQRSFIEHEDYKVRAISSDPRRAHGMRPSLVIADEGAQWPVATSDKMFAALNTALGKMAHSRLIAVGTRPEDQSHWFQRMLEDADFSMCYSADSDDDPFAESTWCKACPQLKSLPHLFAMVQSEARAARRDPALLSQFRALRLNQGISDVAINPLLAAEEWLASEDVDVYGAAKREGPMYWGIDLGATAAMCGLGSYWPVSGRLEGLGAFPSEPSIAKRERSDGVKPGQYQAMRDRGELLVLGHKVVPVDEFLLKAESVFGGRPVRLACDRWRIGELEDAVTAAGWTDVRIEKRGMGYKDGGEDVRLFKSAFLSDKVKPVQSLLMRSAMSECRLVSDPAGNQKIAKKAEGGRRRGGRDDPAVAAVQAVALAERVPVPVKPVLVHVPFG